VAEDDEPTTQELQAAQLRRELDERQAADEADTEEGTATHERRGDKAEYLREKLAEREESERRAAQEED